MNPVKHIKQFARNCVQIRVLAPVLITLAWLALVLLVPSNPWSAVGSIAYLSIMPGYVLYRCIAGYPRGELASRTIGYVVGLSLISLMVLGLGINELYIRLFGETQPLVAAHIAPVIAGYVVLLALLTACRNRVQRLQRVVRYLHWSTWRRKPKTFWQVVAVGILLLLLPGLAAVGAHVLNNNGPNWLALAAIGITGAVMLGMIWTRRLHLQALYPLALYSIALTLLLGTSMRGWEITGHDVMQEFQVFQLTSLNSLWNMNFYQDAYTACLSITILPTILQKLSGIPDPYIFKCVFQVLFALIAPLLYSGLRTYVPRKAAFLAALLFMTFPAFLTDIMMLNRQEVAIFCFGLALTVALDRQLSRWSRHALMIILLGGMVLAHYSTSYITASILLVATGLGFGLWLVRPLLDKLKLKALTARSFTIFPAYVAPLVLLMIVGWSGLATRTAGNIAETIKGIGASVTKVADSQAIALPESPEETKPTGVTIESYADYVYHTRPLTASEYYADATSQDYRPIETPQQNAPVQPALRSVGVSEGFLDRLYTSIRQGYVALLALLLGLGLMLLLLRKVATRLPMQYALLGVSCLVVVVMQVVLPSEAVNYGLARVIQQGLVILALPGVLAAVWLLGKLKIRFEGRLRMTGVAVVAIFLVLSSFISTLTGGFRPALAFSNAGFYYQAYYTHPEEIAADKWLAANAPPGSRVYADEFSRRRMITYANIFAEPTLVPSAIPVDSYVYLSRGNTTTGQVPVYYNGGLLFYNTPTYFLNTHKTLLYNSGGVMIYK